MTQKISFMHPLTQNLIDLSITSSNTDNKLSTIQKINKYKEITR